jgi:peptidoglycan hydrolase-like protein with peptidoglycan-binding domain
MQSHGLDRRYSTVYHESAMADKPPARKPAPRKAAASKASAARPARGNDVRELQLALMAAGFFTGVVDGISGPATDQAVRTFQVAQGLADTGIADEKTRELLKLVAAKAELDASNVGGPQPPDVGAPPGARRTITWISAFSESEALRRLIPMLLDRFDEAPVADADAVLVFISRATVQTLPESGDARTALERARRGATRLIPVILEPVNWAQTPFYEFQAVVGARPLSELEDLQPVVDEIVRILEAPAPPRSAGGRAYLPGYAADDLHGEDLLDRRARVEFLASVLAATQLETPLAIGLFGDWGSGKSFFMRRLQEEVVALTEASAAARKSGRPSYYCSHIRQVSFNAWLYSDSDIWPSFAAQLFRSVAGIETDAPQGKTQTTDLLRYQARVADDLRGLVDERTKAASDTAALEARIDAITKQIADREAKLTERSAAAGAEAGAVARGIADTREIVGGLRRIGRTWRELGGRELAVVIAPLAVAVAFALLAVVQPGWATIASAILLALASVLALLAKAVRHVDEATRLRGEVNELEQVREQLRRERDEQGRTQRRADEGIESELFPLLPRFAEEQAVRWLGREQLGVVTEIRLAFERLSKLIEDSRKARDDGDTNPEKHLPIDRVIVYVDDLDRCQHDVVVRMLETLQLLLSLPHFVVVVGVDSRWLFRSLEVHFRELLSSRDGAGPDAAWAATPQNYLEKIFQYSVVLRPIGDLGFGRLIERLLGPPRSIQTHGPERPAGTGIEATGGAEQDERGETHDEEEEKHEAASTAAIETVDLTPDDLVITPQEIAFMKSLAPMFDTPRAAKRLVNLYRLLRVSIGADELTATEGYEPVLVLLAVGIGFPGLAGDVFAAIERSPELAWPDFVSRLRPRPPEEGASGFANLAAGDLSRSDADAWSRLAAALASVSPPDVADRRLASFVEWIPVVAEFSFHPWQERLPAETHG